MKKKSLLFLASTLLIAPLCGCSKIDENRTIILSIDTPLDLSNANFNSNYGSGNYDNVSKKYTHTIDRIKDVSITISYDGYKSKTVDILTSEMNKNIIYKDISFTEVLSCEVTVEISNVLQITTAEITDEQSKKIDVTISSNKLLFTIPQRDKTKTYNYKVQIDDFSPYDLQISGSETVTGKYTTKIAALKQNEFCVTFTYKGTYSTVKIYDAISQDFVKEINFNSYKTTLMNEVVILNKDSNKSYYYQHNDNLYAFEQNNQKIYLESKETTSETFYIDVTSNDPNISLNGHFFLDTKNKKVLPNPYYFTKEQLDYIGIIYTKIEYGEGFNYIYENYYLDNFKDLLVYSEYNGIQLLIDSNVIQKSKNIILKEQAYHPISLQRQTKMDVTYEKRGENCPWQYCVNEEKLTEYTYENDTLTRNIYAIEKSQTYENTVTLNAQIYKNGQKLEDFKFKFNDWQLYYKGSNLNLDYITPTGSKYNIRLPYIDSYFTVSETSPRVLNYKFPIFIDSLEKAINVMYESSDGKKAYVTNTIYDEKTGKEVKKIESSFPLYILEPNITYITTIYKEDATTESLRFSVTDKQISDGFAYISKKGSELPIYSITKKMALRDNTKLVPYNIKLNSNNVGSEIFENYYTSIVSDGSGGYNFKFSKPEDEVLINNYLFSYRCRENDTLIEISVYNDPKHQMEDILEFSDLYKTINCSISWDFQSEYLFNDYHSQGYYVINPKYKYDDISAIQFDVFSTSETTKSKKISLSNFTFNEISGCYEYEFK